MQVTARPPGRRRSAMAGAREPAVPWQCRLFSECPL